MTSEGQGVIDIHHPLYAGNYFLWQHPIFREADAVIVIASRLCSSVILTSN